MLFLEKNDTLSIFNTQITLSRSCVTATASPRSDIDIIRVDHIENIKRHKPEITGKLFDKFLYAHTLTLR